MDKSGMSHEGTKTTGDKSKPDLDEQKQAKKPGLRRESELRSAVGPKQTKNESRRSRDRSRENRRWDRSPRARHRAWSKNPERAGGTCAENSRVGLLRAAADQIGGKKWKALGSAAGMEVWARRETMQEMKSCCWLEEQSRINIFRAQSQENSMAEKRNSSVEMKNGNSNVLWAAATERDQKQIQHRHAKREWLGL
jgi:hypothetical protein